jgi:hypothetical protein
MIKLSYVALRQGEAFWIVDAFGARNMLAGGDPRRFGELRPLQVVMYLINDILHHLAYNR